MFKVGSVQRDPLHDDAGGVKPAVTESTPSESATPESMACPMCDYPCSADAETCPACGLPFRDDPSLSRRLPASGKIVCGLLFGLGLLGVTLWLV